jgi:hypothetical protein
VTTAPREDDAYLTRAYVDPTTNTRTRRVWSADGRVAAFDGREWWTVCTFTAAQVAQAKAAIRASGLLTAADLAAPANLHDAADLTYTWRLDGRTGQVTNHAYPALAHPAFAALEERLNALEDEATA